MAELATTDPLAYLTEAERAVIVEIHTWEYAPYPDTAYDDVVLSEKLMAAKPKPGAKLLKPGTEPKPGIKPKQPRLKPWGKRPKNAPYIVALKDLDIDNVKTEPQDRAEFEAQWRWFKRAVSPVPVYLLDAVLFEQFGNLDSTYVVLEKLGLTEITLGHVVGGWKVGNRILRAWTEACKRDDHVRIVVQLDGGPSFLRVGRRDSLTGPHRAITLTPLGVQVARRLSGEPDRPVLSECAAAVYEILLGLPEHRGLTGPELVKRLDKSIAYIDQGTLTSRIIPELKPYGIENVRRKGYRIPPSKRPK